MKNTIKTNNTTIAAVEVMEASSVMTTGYYVEQMNKVLFNETFIKASRKSMMKKTQAVNILGLAAYTADGQMKFVKQELAETRLTRLEELLEVLSLFLPTGEIAEMMERATKDFMVVNYGKANADILNIRKYAVIKIKYDGANTRAIAAYLVKDEGKLVKKFLDVVTMEQVDESEITEDYVTYYMLGSTAAGSRTGSVYYYRKGINIDHILNELSYGAWNKMVNKKAHVSTANKNLVRIFAGFSANVNGGEVRDYAMYFGDMAALEDNEKPQDGMLYNSLDLALTATRALLGIEEIPADVAITFAGQVRPFTTKCFSKTIKREQMNSMMDALAGGRENIVVLQREDITPEVEAELDAAFKGKGRFAGKLVVVGDINNVQILSDTNGYKAPFDYKRVSEFTILDLPTDTSAKTSIQLIEKLLVADQDKTIALIKELVEEKCGEEIAALANLQVNIPTFKDAAAGYVHGLTKAINPDYVTADRRMYMSEIKDTKTRIEKMLNKMKFAVDGLNARIHADYAAVFGKRFISSTEVLVSNKVYKKLRKAGIKQIIGIKYPSVGLKEYFKATPISAKQLAKRVQADADLTIEQKEALIGMYYATNDGVTVIGAYAALKDWFAGLDFDYDMICFFFDQRIVEILSNQSQEMVSFDESAAPVEKVEPKATQTDIKSDFGFNFTASISAVKTKVDAAQNVKKEDIVTNELDIKEVMVELNVEFNKDSAHNAFCMFFSFTGVNVGAITNNGLTHDLALLSPEVMRAMLKRAFGKEIAGAPAYKGLQSTLVEIAPGHVVERYAINSVLANQIEEEMKNCARDLDSMIKIFKDLNVVYRFYQELAIDAAKTFITPDLSLELAKGFRPAILNKVTFENPDVEINFQNFEADYEAGKLERTYVFNDPLNEIRSNALKALKGAFDQLSAQSFSSPEAIKEYWEAKLTDQSQVEGLNYLTVMYKRLAAHYAQATAGLEENSPVRAALNKEKRYHYAALRNMFIAITPGMSDQMRGSLAKMLNYYAASQVKGTNRFTVKERTDSEGNVSPIAFAESVMGYEYFANVCKSPSSVPFAGERIVSGKVEAGQFVEFKDGIYISEEKQECAATVMKINGSYEIKEVGGVKYAVKPILELVEAPVVTNHIICEVKSAEVSDDMFAFIKGVKREGLEVAINNFKIDMAEVSVPTTLCGAVKKSVQSTGVIESVLPTYMCKEDSNERILSGIYVVVAVEDLKEFEATTVKTVTVSEEESFEVLRARALAKLNGEAEETVGAPTALQTSLTLDDEVLELDTENINEESSSKVVIPVIQAGTSFDIDDMEDIDL